MIDPSVFWTAALGAGIVGLAYYRWSIQPSMRRKRLEEAVGAFGTAIELRCPSHAGLTEPVTQLAAAVGASMKLGPRRIHRLRNASRLRDIGLCAVPYGLVNGRDWTDWTLAEAATYDCHADVGGAILETIPSLRDLASVVRQHHTPFDRTDETPELEARIIKACDEYVWQRRHLGAAAARRHLELGSGTQYDPAVVAAILHTRVAGVASGS